MNIDMRANSGVGKNEADGVVDVSQSEFVGIEQQWSKGEPSGVGTGALIAAPRRWVNTVEIPHRDIGRGKDAVSIVGLVGFVKLAVVSVYDDQMAIVLVGGTLIARLRFNAAAGWEGKYRNLVGICRIK
jgi:hypothetical protein